mmetsp:Transcript_5350/g.5895  ORF Transcript_5350/g.5895 Transcript_5350/m.5895 type:complete len:379 (-) Transcript_5350:129-1265(-)
MDDFPDVISKVPVVIDNGTGFAKAGFAGDQKPSLICPNFVGRPKHKRIMASTHDPEFYIGKKADEKRGLLRNLYPMRNGVIENWTEMENVWNYIYNELDVQAAEHPVLMTEAPLNPYQNREKAAEIFFETFNCPALFFATQAVLSLYASGRTTGVVLDCGDGVTHCVPVYEGFSLPHAITRIDIAGRDITEHLQLLLRRAGYVFHTTAEMEIVRTIKEKLCYVSINVQSEEKIEKKKRTQIQYVLPDGSAIDLDNERFRAPEVLFSPDKIGLEYRGVHECLYQAISKADIDIRKTLYSEIVLAGGSTLFNGFGERMLQEVKKLSPKDMKIKITAPPDRKLSCWLGGSIISALATFKNMWVSKKEYNEEGRRILHTKTF